MPLFEIKINKPVYHVMFNFGIEFAESILSELDFIPTKEQTIVFTGDRFWGGNKGSYQTHKFYYFRVDQINIRPEKMKSQMPVRVDITCTLIKTQ